MSDDFDSRAGEWLRERAVPDPASLEVVRTSIDGLPARRRRPGRGWLFAAAAAVAVIAIGLSAVLVLPQSSGGAPGVPPVPPDPGAFAGDPRLAACFGAAGPVEFAFEMPRARDYQRHFPAMLLSPELDVDEPAFVVVFAIGAELHVGLSGPPGATGAATPSAGPNERSVCILVGDTPNLYSNVDISGMRVDIGTSPASATPAPSTDSSPTPAVGSTQTVEPAPSWAADLVGQLECDGPAPGLGGEVGELGAWDPGPTPDAALRLLLDAGMFASFPLRGFAPAVVEGHWARMEYRADGRIRAVAVATDRVADFPEGDGWHVVGIRACDASEFDPADGLTFGQTLWRDRDGALARSDRIQSSPGPEHCGWESAIFLWFDGMQYLRDPNGVLAESTVVRFDPDAALPDDAIDTGLHTDDWRLFTTTKGDAVYVVTGTGAVERWGRARDQVGCM
jgi:hypothetical protein